MKSVVAVRQGVAFPPRYVEILRESVSKHYGKELVTLTDQDDTPGETKGLCTRFRGWWSKLELFAPWNIDLRPCLYFDLDTYILEDIRDIEADGFWMLSDFNWPARGASGMMIIPRDTGYIWDRVKNADTSIPQGDQEVLRKIDHHKLQDRFDGIVSYKVHKLQNAPRGRIVCFHGKPKPHECDGWAGDIWAGPDG